MTVTVTNNTEKTVKKIKVLGRTFYSSATSHYFLGATLISLHLTASLPLVLGLPTVADDIDSRTLGREGP